MDNLVKKQQQCHACQENISTAQSNNRKIENDIQEIEALYKKLKTQKDELTRQKTSIGKYVTSSLPTWRGNRYSKNYYALVKSQLVDQDYTFVIKNIDVTLDNLNRKKTELQNKLQQGTDLLSQLKRTLNNLRTDVQNLMN